MPSRAGPPPAAALYGPPGSGKTHLVHAWAEVAGAKVAAAAGLSLAFVAALEPGRAVAVEDVEQGDDALFALFQHRGPLLLTAATPARGLAGGAAGPQIPLRGAPRLPSVAARRRAVNPLARKLFTDRQLAVPDPVIMRILNAVERSPAAVRDFVARADARALAEKRPVTVALVADLLAEGGAS
ncbi:MAG: AAA family ATPase [Rhizomicrobium sp.]